MVTVSLEESKVVVWKVGVGILSLFSPGVPPSGGVPFKVLEFNVGDEGSSLLPLPPSSPSPLSPAVLVLVEFRNGN